MTAVVTSGGEPRARATFVAARHGVVLATMGLVLALSGTAASASDLTRYRGHVLGSSVADVLRISQARESDVATVHERPNRIQSLEWRTPYTSADTAEADPAKAITFGFVDGQLYQLTVSYDRARTEGLTVADLVAGVAAVYGEQANAGVSPLAPAGLSPGAVILGRWHDGAATILLVRGLYDDLHLIVRSTELEARARTAIASALAQDTAEAPSRRHEARSAEAAQARAERARNKAGFRP